MIKEELESLKQSIILALNLIPEDSYVGLVTFGTVVQLYDIAFPNAVKSYVFRGDKEIPLGKIQELLQSFRRPGLILALDPNLTLNPDLRVVAWPWCCV